MVVNFRGNQIFMDFVRFHIREVLYVWCLKYIFSTWFLDIRTSICYQRNTFVYSIHVLNFKGMSSVNTSLNVKYNKTLKALPLHLYESIQLLVRVL